VKDFSCKNATNHQSSPGSESWHRRLEMYGLFVDARSQQNMRIIISMFNCSSLAFQFADIFGSLTPKRGKITNTRHKKSDEQL